MNIYLSLGANLDDRQTLMEEALDHLQRIGRILRISPLYETAPQLPAQIQDIHWFRPFINLVIEFQISSEQSPEDFLRQLKQIEVLLGRQSHERWAPRPIDIDILLWGDLTLHTPTLTIPHPRLWERGFVLAPLKDLIPQFSRNGVPLLTKAKQLKDYAPSLMQIFNVTPDSFSDGGVYLQQKNFLEVLEKIESHLGYIELGAESTRPGATLIEPTEEWERLNPYLELLHERYKSKQIRPKISIDTRHPSTMAKAINMGVDIINDVSGLWHPELNNLFSNSSCDFVLMHSLSIPPKNSETIPPNKSPITVLHNWFLRRIEQLQAVGLDRNRIIIDPGIGFGKSPAQNLEILANINQFASLGCRILVGASRKSFLRSLQTNEGATIEDLNQGLSHFLSEQKIDILRLHQPLGFHFQRLTTQQFRNFYDHSFHKN